MKNRIQRTWRGKKVTIITGERLSRIGKLPSLCCSATSSSIIVTSLHRSFTCTPATPPIWQMFISSRSLNWTYQQATSTSAKMPLSAPMNRILRARASLLMDKGGVFPSPPYIKRLPTQIHIFKSHSISSPTSSSSTKIQTMPLLSLSSTSSSLTYVNTNTPFGHQKQCMSAPDLND